METDPALPSLKSRLLDCAKAWVAAHPDEDVPLSRLAKRVVDDANFFVRLDEMRNGPTTGTLEKFSAYLRNPANWPGECVPQIARDFAHAVGVSEAGAVPSNGQSDELSGGAGSTAEMSAEFRTHGADSAVDDDLPEAAE